MLLMEHQYSLSLQHTIVIKHIIKLKLVECQ